MNKGNKIGVMRNNWRQRTVDVYEDLDDASKVVTIGTPFEGGKPVQCHEARADWKTTIACFPRTYVFN